MEDFRKEKSIWIEIKNFQKNQSLRKPYFACLSQLFSNTGFIFGIGSLFIVGRSFPYLKEADKF